jgi:non-canonical (house-cleaning) NTP pyrophosphatase
VNKVRVVIASVRDPKVNGVMKGFRRAAAHFHFSQEITFDTMDIPSGVAATPLTLDELIMGAKGRAEHAYRRLAADTLNEGTFFAVGVEGGVYSMDGTVFLQSWVSIYDGERFTLGSSGSIQLPESLARSLFTDRIDLGVAIDAFSQKNDIRNKQGTWGILTNDLYTREDSFEEATVNAAAPIFNSGLYRRS